jgi:PD-(D/E)XK nuclease superfamily
MMLMKNASRREYRLKDGTLVPGVTTVLGVLDKPALSKWFWQCGKDDIQWPIPSDGTAGVGTIAHYKIHCWLTGSQPEYDPKWTPEHIEMAEKPFDQFKKHYVTQCGRHAPIFTEYSMVHETLRYGGTPDLLVQTDKGVELWDIKTSKAIYEEYYLQLAGYKMLIDQDPKWRQMKIRPRVVLVTKDGRLEAPDVSVAYMAKARAAWSRLIKFYHEYHAFRKAA